MRDNSSSRLSMRAMLVAVGVLAYVLAAYQRGLKLFGDSVGLLYGVVALALAIVLVRAFRRPQAPRWVACLLAAIAVVVSAGFAFPAWVNPTVQIVINKQALERDVQTQMERVLINDPAFSDITIKLTHRKTLWIDIVGVVATPEELNRLRERVSDGCPALEECLVRWEVHALEE